ncbi:MAG TPA: Mth938-like domain-containing protein [Burkholderiales bacterium]
MKLHLDRPGKLNAITGYGEDYVMVNAVRHERSLVVTPQQVVADWPVSAIETIAPEQVAILVGLDPEIVLLGTGRRLAFPAPQVLAPLAQARIGVEVMDSRAACRTYNILMAEGRRVAAAIIL